MKGRGQIHQAYQFVCRVCGPSAAVDSGVFRKDGDGHTVKAGKTGNNGSPPLLAHFEEGTLITNRLQHGVHLINLPGSWARWTAGPRPRG